MPRYPVNLVPRPCYPGVAMDNPPVERDPATGLWYFVDLQPWEILTAKSYGQLPPVNLQLYRVKGLAQLFESRPQTDIRGFTTDAGIATGCASLFGRTVERLPDDILEIEEYKIVFAANQAFDPIEKAPLELEKNEFLFLQSFHPDICFMHTTAFLLHAIVKRLLLVYGDDSGEHFSGTAPKPQYYNGVEHDTSFRVEDVPRERFFTGGEVAPVRVFLGPGVPALIPRHGRELNEPKIDRRQRSNAILRCLREMVWRAGTG